MIVKGSGDELPIIASEVGRSADSLVRLSNMNPPATALPPEDSPPKRRRRKGRKDLARRYAHDILLLLGNRKLCRAIVASSPWTAIAFFEAVAKQRRFWVPIGQFSTNVSTETILNKDWLLYHEDEGYRAGLLGYLKPFSQAIYGNYELVEALGIGSPLDIRLDLQFSWDAIQLEGYCRAILTTFKSYLEQGHWHEHSFTLFRAFGDLEHACSDLYKLNRVEIDYKADSVQRLRAVVKFIQNAVDQIGELDVLLAPLPRQRDQQRALRHDSYDMIADLMINMISAAMTITAPSDSCWLIQHNMVWGEFFSIGHQGKAWPIVQYKLRRLLYDSIRELESFPNYRSSRILGFCLNVMGLTVGEKKGYASDQYALRKAVLNWTRKNYLRLRQVQPEVADSVLMGGISFDAAENRLVKTYAKGLELEPQRTYLALDPPPA